MKVSQRNRQPRLSLHHIFFAVSLIILLLPIVGFYGLKLFENALIRQTQAELISQASFMSATYSQLMESSLRRNGVPTVMVGHLLPKGQSDVTVYHAIPLDIHLDKTPLLPPRPAGQRPKFPAHPLAIDVGHQMTPILKRTQRVTLSAMKLLDHQGVVVGGQFEQGQSFGHLPEIKQALQGQTVSSMRKRSGLTKQPPLASLSRGAGMNVYVAMPIVIDRYVVGVAWVNRTPMDIMKALYQSRGRLLVMVVAMLVLTLIISIVTTRLVTKPIDALIDKTRRFAEGDPTAKEVLKTPRTRELAELAQSFSAMAETIETRSAYIQQFAAHVSHEFKTPLTAIQGSVELLQDHMDTMDEAEKQRFLSHIQTDTTRLKTLVEGLLALARADMAEADQGRSSLSEFIAHLLAEYDNQPIHVEVTAQPALEELPPVRVTSEMLHTIFSNLIGNSREHGAEKITLAFEWSGPGELLKCKVTDNGEGISEANKAQLFTPFFTTKRNTGGTGLGLCIVQSMLENLGGSISLAEVQPESNGAAFELTLPLCEPESEA